MPAWDQIASAKDAGRRYGTDGIVPLPLYYVLHEVRQIQVMCLSG